jgi:DNA-binding NarL/FixJ family response regulator
VTVSLLIADDHGIVRGGMRLLIDRQPDMEVVAEAEDGVDAFEQALQTRPDLCVMDVSMPRMTGLQAARQIRAHLPETQVLALSMHDDERYVFDALKAGASGYVLKREVDQALLNAIRAVHRGDLCVDPALMSALLTQISAPAKADPEAARIATLTPKERKIVAVVVEGNGAPNKELASRLFIAEPTLRNNLTTIYQKLGVANRLELYVYATKHCVG